jgi:hypothetical protein
MHVFTDQVEELQKFRNVVKNLKVEVHQIPRYEWPEATLYRYRIFDAHRDKIKQELLIHLDADMIVQKWFFEKIPQNLMNGVALVHHPGFFRPKKYQLLKFYFRNPKKFWRDLLVRAREGGLGSWETKRKSRAYVPRNLRKVYVCGGTWLGTKESFLSLVKELAHTEKLETSEQRIPRWHDESFLNEWSSRNRTTILEPSFCFDPTYPQLAQLEEYIRAVDKTS